MKTLTLLVIHVLTTLAKRAGPGGAKAIIAESVLLKHQQLIAHRSTGITPRLTTLDRFLCGLLTLFMRPGRIRKAAVILKPATLTKFRRALLSRNYHRLFSSQKNRKPGPKGPSDDLVRVIVELKQRNTQFGCPRIAQQINKSFGVNIDKDVVRRVLAKHYRSAPYDGGLSWLTFLRHTRDSLFSIALFRRKSIHKISSTPLAISQYTRRLIGYGISVCHLNQTVIFSLFDDAMPMFDASRSLRSIHDQSFSHHRCRRKLFGLAGTGTVTILPRSPPVAARRIRTRRHKHKHHDSRSNYGSIDLEVAHRALNNSCHLFLIPSPLDEKRSTRINIATATSQAECENFTREKYCLAELRTLIAA
jgi:putative transposase